MTNIIKNVLTHLPAHQLQRKGKEMKQKLITRSTGKWTDFIPLAMVLSYLLVILGQILGEVILFLTGAQDRVAAIVGDEGTAAFLFMYFEFIGIWIVFFLVVCIFRNNRPMLKSIAFRTDGTNLRGAAIGLLLGFLANGFCILMSWILGDISLSFNGFRPGLFLVFLVVVTIQSGAEEIIDRCYLYQKLRRGYKNPWIAIIGNAAVFSAMHLMNPGISAVAVLQILVVGILFSLFVYYFDSLWAAIMMHAGWNFTQSIFFGLPNSGIVSAYSVFKLEAASARNGIFYNVNFGVEGSIGAVCVLILLCIITVIVGRKRGQTEDIWKEME